MGFLRTRASNSARELVSAEEFYAVTPNDSTDLTHGQCRALFVGTGGNVAVLNDDGDSVTFAVGDGQVLPIRTTRVLATGTDASGIVALY